MNGEDVTQTRAILNQGKVYMAVSMTDCETGEESGSSSFLDKLSARLFAPPPEDPKGLRITSGHVTLEKDAQNLVGISIGGGAPFCPCLYVVQIFDNTPAARDGTLASGDEIVGVNGDCVKGRSKMDVAKLIQSHKDKVVIMFNKLHADPKQGKSLDIILKKMKHRVVEGMSSSTADALGLSRAILVNDSLLKKLEEMNDTAQLFQQLGNYVKKLVCAIYELAQTHKAFGEVFSQVGCKEPQPRASEAFTDFATSHRSMEKYAMECLQSIKPIMNDISTFTKKVVPDMKLTIKKYLDSKFEYLSYCLKVKEMDDEEYSFSALNEPLYRVESGNYEYRLILRCRQDARMRFARLRNDVMEKLELLDNKHVQDVVSQLHRFVEALSSYYQSCYNSLKDAQIFPIELELNYSTFQSEEEEKGEENVSPYMDGTEPVQSIWKVDTVLNELEPSQKSDTVNASYPRIPSQHIRNNGYQLIPLMDTFSDGSDAASNDLVPIQDEPLLEDPSTPRNTSSRQDGIIKANNNEEDVALLDCFMPPPDHLKSPSVENNMSHDLLQKSEKDTFPNLENDVDLLTDL